MILPLVPNRRTMSPSSSSADDRRRMKPITSSFLALLAVSCVLIGCSRNAGEKSGAEIRTVADLKGCHCGIVTGTVLQDVVDAVQKGDTETLAELDRAIDLLMK